MSRTSSGRSRSGLALLLAAWALVLTGCVNVPTTGPIDKVEGSQPGCQNCVNVEVAPPAVGDEPRQVVEGYLRATSNYQPNYSVAKQFLTASAAEKWSPEDGASIYRGSARVNGDSVTFAGTLVGSLARDRTYTARDQKLRLDFGLVREGGEWRISTPPPGLMVAEFSFSSFYQAYELYFIGNNQSLVPDPIYLPKLRNPANVASALMQALLDGPSTWLKPAVSSALPPGTTLSVNSVTINDGVAGVPLSDTVLKLSEAQRTQMAAQVVYTLKQVAGVKSVLFSVNQQPLRVPQSDPSGLVVPISSIPPDLDPIPFVAAEQLYAVQGRSVQLVSANADQSTLRPVPGALGEGAYAVDSLAVSVANTDLAVVTDGRTVLRRAPTGDTSTSTVLADGATELLRPQFTRYDEIWDIGRLRGRQRVWMFTADRRLEVDAAQVLGGGQIVAFKISPDGTRMALIRKTRTGVELGLCRINRSDVDKVTVDGWRPLDTTQSNKAQVTRLADVGWLDATTLLVLGAATADAALGPVQVTEDAYGITAQNQANQWDAVELTVLLRSQTTQTAVILGRDGQTYRDDGNQWQPFLDKIKTVAYPG